MCRHEKLDHIGSNPNFAIYCIISMTQFPHLYNKNFNIGLPSLTQKYKNDSILEI